MIIAQARAFGANEGLMALADVRLKRI